MTELNVSEFKIIDPIENTYNNINCINKYVSHNSIENNESLTMVEYTNCFDLYKSKTPIMKHEDFKVNENEDYFVIDNASGVTRITFPNPETSKGKGIMLKNTQNQEVLSTESIVQYLPRIISNKIFSSDKPYKQAYLVSNGFRWIIENVK